MIILDLDDTLIDTRGTLRPIKLRDAGKRIGSPQVADWLEGRASENRSGKLIISEACAVFDLSDEQEREMLDEYYHQQVDAKIPLLPGAREALERLSAEHDLFLVSAGLESRQRRKVELARLARERNVARQHVVVIGDKLSDVEPAEERGMVAIRFGASWEGASAQDWPATIALLEGFGALRHG